MWVSVVWAIYSQMRKERGERELARGGLLLYLNTIHGYVNVSRYLLPRKEQETVELTLCSTIKAAVDT